MGGLLEHTLCGMQNYCGEMTTDFKAPECDILNTQLGKSATGAALEGAPSITTFCPILAQRFIASQQPDTPAVITSVPQEETQHAQT